MTSSAQTSILRPKGSSISRITIGALSPRCCGLLRFRTGKFEALTFTYASKR